MGMGVNGDGSKLHYNVSFTKPIVNSDNTIIMKLCPTGAGVKCGVRVCEVVKCKVQCEVSMRGAGLSARLECVRRNGQLAQQASL